MSNVTEALEKGALPSLDATVLGAPISKKRANTNVSKLIILIIFIAAFLFVVFGILWFAKMKSAAKNDKKAVAKEEVKTDTKKNEALESATIERLKASLKTKEEDDREKRETAMLAQAAQAARAAQKAQQPPLPLYGQPIAVPQTGAVVPNTPAVPTASDRKLSGPVLMAYGSRQSVQSVKEASAPAAQDQGSLAANLFARLNTQPTNATSAQPDSGIGSKLRPTVIESRSAGVLPNLDYLLKRGTSIPCALKTGIDTTLPGFVVCNAISDVYSANGRTLLVERGASIFGEQQSSLKQGQERTFVLWTRIDNPSGVTANLDSPGTDQMGFNGVPGYVDTHFWKRFGGATLVSAIKDFSQVLVARQSNSNGGPTYNNTTQTTQDLAVETLRNSINIPPTLIVNPASVVYVLVARDVSFESVYSLEK